ncbi:MAG: DUF4411 family protein [Bacteroidales bacterium]|jgi:rRNA-processing protein FCF1
MNLFSKTYCLDANVLIQAWQKYYSPKFCPSYWEVLNSLGSQGRIFIPETVKDEIVRTEDDLTKWLRNSNIPILKIDQEVTNCLRDIYSNNPLHMHLVDNIKNRSLADPWVIAHAIKERAVVVTKEEKLTAINSNRIKIPNVCENMGVPWIDDFMFIDELNIQFTCNLR